MTLSFFYLAFRRVLELFVLRFRPDLEKDLELIVLGHRTVLVNGSEGDRGARNRAGIPRGKAVKGSPWGLAAAIWAVVGTHRRLGARGGRSDVRDATIDGSGGPECRLVERIRALSTDRFTLSADPQSSPDAPVNAAA